MNIHNREQFSKLIQNLRVATTVVVDTETTGLSVFEGHRPISMSFYFPDFDTSYNLAWGHGVGKIWLPAKVANEPDLLAAYNTLKWVGAEKEQIYKTYWYERIFKHDDYGNVPMEWVDELRKVWNSRAQYQNVNFVFFNAPFDIHMLDTIGFNQPRLTEDVRIAVSIVFEGWGDKEIEHGHTNNTLKWQANYWKIEGALDGEAALAEAAENMAYNWAQRIAPNWDAPVHQTFHKLKRPATVGEIAEKITINPKSEMWLLHSDEVAPYAENDTRITWLLREHLVKLMEPFDQFRLYQEVSASQNEFAIRMEKNGVLLDRERALELVEELGPIKGQVNDWFRTELERYFEPYREHLVVLAAIQKLKAEEAKKRPNAEKVEQYEAEIAQYAALHITGFDLEEIKTRAEAATQHVSLAWYALTDTDNNIDFTVASPTKLKLVLTLLTGEEFDATDKEALEAWREDQLGDTTVVDKVLEFRHAERAVKTYLLNWISSQDEAGFIHPSFNVNGTVTGRWSSSSGTLGDTGNFQNIPSRGFSIKEALVTPEGWKLIGIDYGQLELRLAAWDAGQQTMIDMFNSGADMHAYTRDQAGVHQILFGNRDLWEQVGQIEQWGKLAEQPENDEKAKKVVSEYARFVSKTLNFGLLYGGSWRMVSRLLKLPEQQSRELHKAWNSLYPEFSLANREAKERGLTRRPRPDGTGSLMYEVQPISGRTRKLIPYPIFYEGWDKKKEQKFTTNPRDKVAKDLFNFRIQGLGGYIMAMSGTQVAREFSNEIFRPFAMIHDAMDMYIREDSLHILPRIVEIMTDWDVNPRLTVDVEVSIDRTWQRMIKISNMKRFLERGEVEYMEKGELKVLIPA